MFFPIYIPFHSFPFLSLSLFFSQRFSSFLFFSLLFSSYLPVLFLLRFSLPSWSKGEALEIFTWDSRRGNGQVRNNEGAAAVVIFEGKHKEKMRRKDEKKRSWHDMKRWKVMEMTMEMTILWFLLTSYFRSSELWNDHTVSRLSQLWGFLRFAWETCQVNAQEATKKQRSSGKKRSCEVLPSSKFSSPRCESMATEAGFVCKERNMRKAQRKQETNRNRVNREREERYLPKKKDKEIRLRRRNVPCTFLSEWNWDNRGFCRWEPSICALQLGDSARVIVPLDLCSSISWGEMVHSQPWTAQVAPKAPKQRSMWPTTHLHSKIRHPALKKFCISRNVRLWNGDGKDGKKLRRWEVKNWECVEYWEEAFTGIQNFLNLRRQQIRKKNSALKTAFLLAQGHSRAHPGAAHTAWSWHFVQAPSLTWTGCSLWVSRSLWIKRRFNNLILTILTYNLSISLTSLTI